MKAIKHIFFLLITITTFNTFAQKTPTKAEKKQAKQAAIKTMVEGQKYDFIAQYANPLGGGHRFLTSTYDVLVKKDSVIAFLPYFGQAYFDIPYNPTDGGIKFTSTKFSYKITERKKGGWNVIIKPQDVKNVNTLNFFISTEGYTTLQFTLTNRSAISFDGYLNDEPGKK